MQCTETLFFGPVKGVASDLSVWFVQAVKRGGGAPGGPLGGPAGLNAAAATNL